MSIFTSRKFWLAVATIIGLVLSKRFGLELDTTTIYAVLAVVVANILGIAIEDHGTKSRTVAIQPKPAVAEQPYRRPKRGNH